MNRKAICCIWKDASKEDINTTKFLELLLQYNYVWRGFNKEMKLNLTKKKKGLFLKDCRKLIEDLDELKASEKIEIIRQLYIQEYSRLQASSKNVDELIFPWFFLAYQLFQCTPTSKNTRISSSVTAISANSLTVNISKSLNVNAANSSITSATTPLIDRASDFSPTTKINASTSATASFLSPKSTVQPFPWTSLLPYWKSPSLNQDLKQPTNPSVMRLSARSICDSKSSQWNMKPQYPFPVKYPVCILPCASLGRFGEGSNISYPRTDKETLSGIEISIHQSSLSTRPHAYDV